MKAIEKEDLLSREEYERRRREIVADILAIKNQRRLHLGEHLTLLFENEKTVWYQVQEMIRIEGLTRPEDIQHELDTYNELLPKRGELSATLLVEFSDPDERDRALRAIVGLDRHLWMMIDKTRYAAHFDPRQIASDRFSSVQFVRFPIPEVSAASWLDHAAGGRIRAVVDHPWLSASAPIDGPLAESLAGDLE